MVEIAVPSALSEMWDKFFSDEPVPDWMQAFRLDGRLVPTDIGQGIGVGRGAPLVELRSGDVVFTNLQDIGGSANSRLTLYSADQGVLQSDFYQPHNRRKIRFSVGRPGLRSTTWTLFGSKHNDVYLASRRTGGFAKFSLHQSGDWRLQWTGEDRKAWRYTALMEGNAPAGRVMESWRAPLMDQSWTKALSILVPAEDVSVIPEDEEPLDETAWIPEPDLGSMISFELWFMRPHPDPSTLVPISHRIPDGFAMWLIGGIRLPRGDSALLWAFSEPLDLAQRAMLARTRKRGGESDRTQFGARILFSCEDEAGRKEFWDLSAETLNPWPIPGTQTFVRGAADGRRSK